MRTERESRYGYSQHVLVLDKDAQVLEVTRKRLEGDGYKVTTSSADVCVELAIDVLRPEVVLLDPLMSDVIWDGLPALLRAYPADGAVPIILHSSVMAEVLSNVTRIRGSLGLIRKTEDHLEFSFAFNGVLDQRPDGATYRTRPPSPARSGTHAIDLGDDVGILPFERAVGRRHR